MLQFPSVTQYLPAFILFSRSLIRSWNPSMDIHRAHNHPSINSAVPGTRIEISIRGCFLFAVEISVAERVEIGQPEVADTLDAFPTVHITVVS